MQVVGESEKLKLPLDFDYTAVKQLSNEAKDKLNQFKPVSLGQAARIPGVTPADISLLQVMIARRKLEETAIEPVTS